MGRKGFTLIELVMVIVILGILAAVAIPKFVDLTTEARQAAEAGVVGAVRSGIAIYRAEQCTTGACAWPPALDTIATVPATCSGTNQCFESVLEQPITTNDWEKTTATTYTGPAGTVYTYTAGTGRFN